MRRRFQPPYVSNTKTMAMPKSPSAGARPHTGDIESATGGATHPANTTATRPATSTSVSAFCVRTEACNPTTLIAVSAITTIAAHAALEELPSGATVDR